MRLKCVSCGKMFELSDDELRFFKSKKLHTPKRCRACRNARRKDNSVQNLTDNTAYMRHHTTAKKTTVPLVNVLSIIAIIAILIFAALNIFNDDRPSDTSETSITHSSSLTFRTAEYLAEHYAKHGGNTGDSSAAEYLQGANAVVNSSDVLTKVQSDSDTAYFLQSSGEFVVVSHDGYIRTYFVPEDGLAYFNRQ